MSMDDTKYAALMAIGKSAADSISEMVAALECDYDRLEDLRDTLRNCDVDLANGNCAYKTHEMDEMRVELAELIAEAGECESREDAEQCIQEDALSIEVRSGWTSLGDDLTAEEFCILLTTGGPAVRIVGDLSDGEPSRPRLEVQDWGTPWTEYRLIERSTLEAYCSCFYFGE